MRRSISKEGFKGKYNARLAKFISQGIVGYSQKVKPGEEARETELLSKKRGKPPLLREKLDIQLQQLILSMRARGVPIGTSAAIGMGRGIFLKHNRSL